MEKIISDTYTDLAGFNNLKDHFKSAKAKDKDITLDDVRKWRAKNIELKTNLKGYNTWVPSRPREEYQMDLAFFPDDDEDEKYQGVLFMIDPFSKYASGYPFKSKQPNEILNCIKECIEKMGGKPETIYSDFEGSFNSKEIQNYFKENNIRWIYTTTHAAYIESFIKTIKNYIYKRAEYHGKPWHEYLWSSLLVYNNKSEHSATGLTPADANRKKNEFEVRLKLLLNKKMDRKYPPVSVGSLVKVYRKKDLKHKKQRFSVWQPNKHKVEEITTDKHGQHFYKLAGLPKLYLRHEILLVE